MMKLPKNIRGLHIWCSTCSQVCNNPKRKCKKNPHLLVTSCEGTKKYQSRIWNPLTKKTDKVKTWSASGLTDVINLHKEYKQQLKEVDFQLKIKKVNKPLTFASCAAMYLDYLQDIDVPDHEKKNISKNHIKRINLRLKAFADIVGRETHIGSITTEHVGMLHKYLLEEKKFMAETYNGYMISNGALFRFLMSRGYEIENPFRDVKKRYIVRKVEIITDEEFDSIINVIKPENGNRPYKGRNRYLYFPWLIPALKLARLTGARREEIMTLQWKDVKDNYIMIPNLKVNRAKKVDDHSIVPITQDLAELLLELKPKEEGYLIAPDFKNREVLTNYLTTCFSHFWEHTGNQKKVSFKHLRKTYITRIRILLGDKAKALKNHRSEEIQINHYLNQMEIQKELTNVRLF